MTAAMQRTLTRPVRFEGVGLHTGEPGAVIFRPAAVGTGVQFVRADLPVAPQGDDPYRAREERGHGSSAR